MYDKENSKQPGVCVSWDEAKAEWPTMTGGEELAKKVWEENDAEAYMFLWQCVLSF